MHHNGRGFELELDPRGLPEGLHYTGAGGRGRAARCVRCARHIGAWRWSGKAQLDSSAHHVVAAPCRAPALVGPSQRWRAHTRHAGDTLPVAFSAAELQAFDATAEWRGPLFRLPITVIKPLDPTAEPGSSSGSGAIVRPDASIELGGCAEGLPGSQPPGRAPDQRRYTQLADSCPVGGGAVVGGASVAGTLRVPGKERRVHCLRACRRRAALPAGRGGAALCGGAAGRQLGGAAHSSWRAGHA